MFLRQVIIQTAIAIGYYWKMPSSNEKKPANRPQPKPVFRKPVKGLPYDVHSLSDGDMARQLKSYGQVVGPITDTTRPLYQKKLVKLLTEESKNPVSVPKVDDKPRPWEYSDTEENEEDDIEVYKPTPKPEPVVENGQEEKEDDEIDAIPEPKPSRPSRARKTPTRKPAEEPKMTPAPPDTNRDPPETTQAPPETTRAPPQVVKRETVIQETYMETRKRTTAENKAAKTTTAVKKEVKPSNSSAEKAAKVKRSGSMEWKAILILVVITTIILLVFYFMEQNPDKPSITSGGGQKALKE